MIVIIKNLNKVIIIATKNNNFWYNIKKKKKIRLDRHYIYLFQNRYSQFEFKKELLLVHVNYIKNI